jgi:hypothetical protein
VLLARQRKIGDTYFNLVPPLDNFRVEDGTLAFDDLGVRHGITPPRKYTVRWSEFENRTERRTAIPESSSWRLPRSGAEYLVADISGADDGRSVSVYVRNRGGRTEVVGIERFWTPRGAPLPEASRARTASTP